MVNAGVGGFLAVDGTCAEAAVVVEAEFFGDEAVVEGGGDFFDEIHLVGAVAVPVDGGDSQSGDFPNGFGKDVGGVEIAEEEVERALGMSAGDLFEELFGSFGTLAGDEFGVDRI